MSAVNLWTGWHAEVMTSLAILHAQQCFRNNMENTNKEAYVREAKLSIIWRDNIIPYFCFQIKKGSDWIFKKIALMFCTVQWISTSTQFRVHTLTHTHTNAPIRVKSIIHQFFHHSFDPHTQPGSWLQRSFRHVSSTCGLFFLSPSSTTCPTANNVLHGMTCGYYKILL